MKTIIERQGVKGNRIKAEIRKQKVYPVKSVTIYPVKSHLFVFNWDLTGADSLNMIEKF